MELFLSLPAEQMEKFVATGRIYMQLGVGPYRFQAACQERLETGLSKALANKSQYMTSFFTALLDEGTTIQLSYEESGAFGDGVGAGISGDDKAGRSFRMGGVAIPPSLPGPWEARQFRELLQRSEPPGPMDVDRVLEDLVRKCEQALLDRRDRQRQAEWQEPSSANLHRPIKLPQDLADPVEVQRFVAREAGPVAADL